MSWKNFNENCWKAKIFSVSYFYFYWKKKWLWSHWNCSRNFHSFSVQVTHSPAAPFFEEGLLPTCYSSTVEIPEQVEVIEVSLSTWRFSFLLWRTVHPDSGLPHCFFLFHFFWVVVGGRVFKAISLAANLWRIMRRAAFIVEEYRIGVPSSNTGRVLCIPVRTNTLVKGTNFL